MFLPTGLPVLSPPSYCLTTDSHGSLTPHLMVRSLMIPMP